MPDHIREFLQTLTHDELARLKTHWVHVEQKRRLEENPPPVIDTFNAKG